VRRKGAGHEATRWFDESPGVIFFSAPGFSPSNGKEGIDSEDSITSGSNSTRELACQEAFETDCDY